MDDSARQRAALQDSMKPVFEARATEIIEHAGRPEALEEYESLLTDWLAYGNAQHGSHECPT